MERNLTEAFIDDLHEIGKMSFSEKTVNQANRCLLDYLGATFAGVSLQRDRAGIYLDRLEGTLGESRVIGLKRRASLTQAALVNGVNSHIAEMDDGCRFGGIHPGSPVFSALLPVAEKEQVHRSDFIKGVIVAYEAAIKIARSVMPGHYALGYHPTGTCGALGAAMGIGAMLNFSKEKMKDALSAAAVGAAGMLKVIEDGSELKPFNAGRAAASAVMAAYTADAGYYGLDNVMEGDIGFLAMMSGHKASEIIRSDGDRLEIGNVYFKPYASCRHTHPPIEAVLALLAERDLDGDDIGRIDVRTYKTILGKHDHHEIKSVSSAKMSLPFSVALTLIAKDAGIGAFTEDNVRNKAILELTKKVNVIGDEEISALVPEKRAAVVDIVLKGGGVLSHRVDYPKGEPENKMTHGEVKEKFISLARYGGMGEHQCQEIISQVFQVSPGMDRLFALLS